METKTNIYSKLLAVMSDVDYINPSDKRAYRNKPIEQRFLSKAVFCPPSDCLLWLGGYDHEGYGMFCDETGATRKAHKTAYRLFVSDIPKGLHILHRCDNRACVNPTHLYAGTHQQNMEDKRTRGRSARHIGSKHPRAKLTEQRVAEIRSKVSQGFLHREIASEYGISRPTVSDIISHKSWRHSNG
jgi:hypothetical protein